MDQDRNAPGRPLTARSVLLSLLLGNDPPRSPVSSLVRTAELFGIAEGTARTALSRMAAAGEVGRTDDGWYELRSSALLARQQRQRESRSASTRTWTRHGWIQAVVVADGPRSAADRAASRRRMLQDRLGELREGVWMRPDNLGDLDDLRARDLDGTELQWFEVGPVDDAGALTRRLWDLPAWSARARELVDDMRRLHESLARLDHAVLAAGFVTSADVLRHLQHDPLLPPELWPTGWPGATLRATYDEYDATYRRALAAWFR